MANTAPCPICGKPAQQDTKPFCSKRCKDVDLSRWFHGSYAVTAVENDDDDAEITNEEEN